MSLDLHFIKSCVISLYSFNGWGVTMYDSLDTLWLMGLQPEFERAVERISQADFGQTHVRLL